MLLDHAPVNMSNPYSGCLEAAHVSTEAFAHDPQAALRQMIMRGCGAYGEPHPQTFRRAKNEDTKRCVVHLDGPARAAWNVQDGMQALESLAHVSKTSRSQNQQRILV